MLDNILSKIPFKFHAYINSIVDLLHIDVDYISYTDSIQIYNFIISDLSCQYDISSNVIITTKLPNIDTVALFALNYA